MKSNKLLAKVQYNNERDSFDVTISSDGGETWGLETSYFCQKAEGIDEPDGEKKFSPLAHHRKNRSSHR